MFWPGRRSSEATRRARAVFRLYRRARGGETAETRGLKLLRSWLSPEQLVQFDTLGYFDVIGGASGKKYRIRFGICANIQELDRNDCPQAGWCFVPETCLVPGDVMLAQKVALETDERAALAIANKFGAPIPPAARYIPT